MAEPKVLFEWEGGRCWLEDGDPRTGRRITAHLGDAGECGLDIYAEHVARALLAALEESRTRERELAHRLDDRLDACCGDGQQFDPCGQCEDHRILINLAFVRARSAAR